MTMVDSRNRFPGPVDLEFYQSKRPIPGWAFRIQGRKVKRFWSIDGMSSNNGVALIDLVVNAHAGIRGGMVASNILVLLREHRSRGHRLGPRLRAMAQEVDGPNGHKRAALARKWAKRLGEDFDRPPVY